jgi:transposase
MSAAFIGLDLAKSVFQVHGVDAQGKVVVTKRLRRDAVLAFFANLAPCVVGMEACAGSHFWARDCPARPHVMAPQYVKPYTQTPQERPGRCRGDLRGGAAADDSDGSRPWIPI